MGQELADRHPRHFHIGVVGQVPAQRRVKVDRSGFDQLKHRNGREHLAGRCEEHRSVEGHGGARGRIGEAPTPRQRHSAASRDDQRSGEFVACRQPRRDVDNRIDRPITRQREGCEIQILEPGVVRLHFEHDALQAR